MSRDFVEKCSYIELAKNFLDQTTGFDLEKINEDFNKKNKFAEHAKGQTTLRLEDESSLLCEYTVIYVNGLRVTVELQPTKTNSNPIVCKFDFHITDRSHENNKIWYRHLVKQTPTHYEKFLVFSKYGKHKCLFMQKWDMDLEKWIENPTEGRKQAETEFQSRFTKEITDVRQSLVAEQIHYTDIKPSNILISYHESSQKFEWCYGDLESFCFVVYKKCHWTSSFLQTASAYQKVEASLQYPRQNEVLKKATKLYEKYGFTLLILSVLCRKVLYAHNANKHLLSSGNEKIATWYDKLQKCVTEIDNIKPELQKQLNATKGEEKELLSKTPVMQYVQQSAKKDAEKQMLAQTQYVQQPTHVPFDVSQYSNHPGVNAFVNKYRSKDVQHFTLQYNNAPNIERFVQNYNKTEF